MSESPKPAAAVDLEALKRVAEEATPGPWHLTIAEVISPVDENDAYICAEPQLCCDADFIVAANPAVVLSLIAELEQLRKALASVDGGVDLPQLEACAELVAALEASGPTESLRRRVMLLADWQRIRKLPAELYSAVASGEDES